MPYIPKTTKRPWIPERKPQEGRRVDNSAFYSSTAWKKLRAAFKRANPICAWCIRKGMIVPASVVYHVTPISQGGDPYAWDNLQSLCEKCHNQKSGSESKINR